MVNRKTARLGDLATYVNGYAFKPSDWGETGLPIIRIQDLTGNSYQLNRYEGEYPDRIEVNNGDVLISWSASLGVYVWQRGKALLISISSKLFLINYLLIKNTLFLLLNTNWLKWSPRLMAQR